MTFEKFACKISTPSSYIPEVMIEINCLVLVGITLIEHGEYLFMRGDDVTWRCYLEILGVFFWFFCLALFISTSVQFALAVIKHTKDNE